MTKQYTITELLNYVADCCTSVQAETVSELGEHYNSTIWLDCMDIQDPDDYRTGKRTYEYEDMSTEKCEMSSEELVEKYKGTLFTLVLENKQ